MSRAYTGADTVSTLDICEALADADSAFVNLTYKLPASDFDAELLADALNRIRAALAAQGQAQPAAPQAVPAVPALTKTDIARIWRKVYGGTRAGPLDFEFAQALLAARPQAEPTTNLKA